MKGRQLRRVKTHAACDSDEIAVREGQIRDVGRGLDGWWMETDESTGAEVFAVDMPEAVTIEQGNRWLGEVGFFEALS